MIVLSTDTTKNAEIKNAVYCPLLEPVTGADIMISDCKLPLASEMLIKKHVSNGAILIQQKNGLDMWQSVQHGRLTSQLARMYEAGAKFIWQRLILFVGEVVYSNGLATINNTNIGLWWQWQSALDAIRIARAGALVTLPHLALVPEWLAQLDKKLPEWKANPTKEVYPSVDFQDMPTTDDPLQIPTRVTDWRRILVAACPGIGPQRATDLRNAMLEFGAQDTFLQALNWGTDNSGAMPKVKGWGTGTKEQLRQAIGLGEKTTCQIATYWSEQIKDETE